MVGALRLCGRPFCPIAAPAARKPEVVLNVNLLIVQ